MTSPLSPEIRPAGLDAWVVRFATVYSDAANRAARAFHAALEADPPEGLEETAPALASVLVRFDPLATDPDALRADLDARLRHVPADPPPGRLWEVPAAFDPDVAPGLAEVSRQTGATRDDIALALCATPLRVLTLGFAPGQPYIGTLPERWDLPRLRDLAPTVPRGALALAVRQLTLFAAPSRTGWHHIAQTALTAFDPSAPDPMVLRAGDALQFVAVPPHGLAERPAVMIGDAP